MSSLPWSLAFVAVAVLLVQAPLIWIVWVGSLRQHAEDRELIQRLTAAFLALKVPERPQAALSLEPDDLAGPEGEDEDGYDSPEILT